MGHALAWSLVGIKIDVRIDVSDVSSTHKTPQNTPKSPIFSHFLVQRLHGGEQQNVADGLAVGQQHGHAVDAEADAARGGHAQLEGVEEVLVGGKMALKGHLGDDFCCFSGILSDFQKVFLSAEYSVSSLCPNRLRRLETAFRAD